MTESHSILPLWLTLLSLQQQATNDWLTGVYNRRYFETTLQDHIEAAQRYNRPLSLVLFDINHFKQVNDTQGHVAGDALLKQFATLLKKCARKADIVCRYGGDEFAVILPESDLKAAQRFANRLQEQLAKATDKKLAASFGLATLPSDALLQAADQDLLQQKRERR